MSPITVDAEALGALILRILIGGVFLGHGLQKALGLWGGMGPRGWWESLTRRGLRPVVVWWSLSLGAEVVAAPLMVLGLLTPLAASALVAHVVVILNDSWDKGFWNQNKGMEFPLVLGGGALSIAFLGPGRWSMDAWLQIDLPSELIVSVFVVSVGVAILAVVLERRRAAHAKTAT